MKKAKDMTDRQLLASWQRGREWMMKHEGKDEVWGAGLKRMEELEDEIKVRKIGPWKRG